MTVLASEWRFQSKTYILGRKPRQNSNPTWTKLLDRISGLRLREEPRNHSYKPKQSVGTEAKEQDKSLVISRANSLQDRISVLEDVAKKWINVSFLT